MFGHMTLLLIGYWRDLAAAMVMQESDTLNSVVT